MVPMASMLSLAKRFDPRHYTLAQNSLNLQIKLPPPKMQFAVGDTVGLKSGSPRMTIEKLEGTSATCVWLDRNGKLHREPIETSALFLRQSAEEKRKELGD